MQYTCHPLGAQVTHYLEFEFYFETNSKCSLGATPWAPRSHVPPDLEFYFEINSKCIMGTTLWAPRSLIIMNSKFYFETNSCFLEIEIPF